MVSSWLSSRYLLLLPGSAEKPRKVDMENEGTQKQDEPAGQVRLVFEINLPGRFVSNVECIALHVHQLLSSDPASGESGGASGGSFRGEDSAGPG